MSAPGAAKAVKSALVTVCRTLWPDPVKVTYGPIGIDEPDDTVEILDVSFAEGEPRLGTLRRRWHDFTLTGRLATYRGGGEEAQLVATEAALDMLAELADYLQDSGTSPSTQTSLGNVVQWARLSSFDVTEEAEEIEHGRQTYIDFAITGQVVA